MSINNTLSNALTGLVATSRAAEVVSANIANAMTDGYGVRELQLSAASIVGRGTGVQVDGVQRHADPVLINDRRGTQAEQGGAQVVWAFFDRTESSIGLPGEAGSLSDRLTKLETSLIEATSRPDSQPRLMNVLQSAEGLARQLKTISDDIQGLRQQADREIETQVRFLNTSLGRVAELNRDIRLQSGAGRDASALMDQRQAAIDKISALVPMTEIKREHGEVALFTKGGAILVDDKAAEVTFQAVGLITPDMTYQSGALGKLMVNGEIVNTTRERHAMNGGQLAELFNQRDRYGVEIQTAADGVARDLIERFQSPTVDPTLGPTDPGLFTDQGNALDITDEIGLASRLQVNDLVDPAKGGEIWRLRNGLNATGPGEVGDARTLSQLSSALQVERVPASGGFSATARSASGLASDLLSRVGTKRETADFELTYTSNAFAALRELELADGVDTDSEMQNLLVIEQAFAANARVVSVVDDMIQQLLGI